MFWGCSDGSFASFLTSFSFWSLLTFIHELLVLWAAVLVLRRPREPRAMLAWILALLFLPVVGLFLFVFFGEPRMRRTRRRRHRRRKHVAESLERNAAEARGQRDAHQALQDHEGLTDLVHVVNRLVGRPPTRGNKVTIFTNPGETMRAKMAAIASAREHVHLEYYILQPDSTGAAMRDLLIEKAKQGVTCRVLLDYVGCWSMPRSFVNAMREAGVQLAFYMPVVPLRGRWRINFRNHRKIIVIDGQIGFTGSMNIGDEYAGHQTPYGRWRDTHLKLEGPVVLDLQEVFIEDWYYATHHDIVHVIRHAPPAMEADHMVQIIPSGPDRNTQILPQTFFTALTLAKEEITIVTPYFVPDEAMVVSLQAAANAGIRVRLMIPSRSDHRIVLWAGRSYYNDLIQAGVEVYEYPKNMLHSKVMTVDHICAIVGSANMDERSFRLNWELSTILYDDEVIHALLEDFNQLCGDAVRIQYRRTRDLPFFESLKLGLARMASPLV